MSDVAVSQIKTATYHLFTLSKPFNFWLIFYHVSHHHPLFFFFPIPLVFRRRKMLEVHTQQSFSLSLKGAFFFSFCQMWKFPMQLLFFLQQSCTLVLLCHKNHTVITRYSQNYLACLICLLKEACGNKLYIHSVSRYNLKTNLGNIHRFSHGIFIYGWTILVTLYNKGVNHLLAD